MLLGPFSAELSGDYRRMIETNLLGAITTTEVFLDQLVARGGGDLINLSSVAGRTARPGNAVYAATKWGVNGWSESLRQQLQPGVRVIVIEPGAVATELTDHITHAETKAAAEQMYEQTSIARAGHRRDHRVRRLTPAHRVAQRDPRAPDRPGGMKTRTRTNAARDDPTMTATTTPRLTLNNGVTYPPSGSASSRRPPTRPATPSASHSPRGTGTSTPPRPMATSARSARRCTAPGWIARRCSWRPRSGSATTDTTKPCTALRRAPEARRRADRPADLHQALPSAFDWTLEAYRALETLLVEGKVRAIGVSNFMVEHLTALLDHAGVEPAVNQIECHPYSPTARPGLRGRARHPHASVVSDRRDHLLPRR